MISCIAIRQTIERLSRRPDFERYGSVVVAFRILLEEQDKVEGEAEDKHEKIMSDIEKGQSL